MNAVLVRTTVTLTQTAPTPKDHFIARVILDTLEMGLVVKVSSMDGNCSVTIALKLILEWFSKRTGTSFQNDARSKNAEKKLGRERRRVVLKSDLAVVSTNRPRYICS